MSNKFNWEKNSRYFKWKNKKNNIKQKKIQEKQLKNPLKEINIYIIGNKKIRAYSEKQAKYFYCINKISNVKSFGNEYLGIINE